VLTLVVVATLPDTATGTRRDPGSPMGRTLPFFVLTAAVAVILSGPARRFASRERSATRGRR
jgi:hypothetical protein